MKKLFVFFFLVIFISVSLLGRSLDHVMAKESPVSCNRYYKSILIESGDSLWSIAQEYHNGFMTVEEYMSELRSMNRLCSDTIHTGQYLTVVYFE